MARSSPAGLKACGCAPSRAISASRHTDYVTALGMGPAEVITAGNKHIAACMGGMVSVLGGRVTLTATTFEWAEDIDTARSHASEERAREKLGHGDLTDTELALAEARLKRALIRQQVSRMK
jgi:F-type H+-transporting ATPase subunit epsilon